MKKKILKRIIPFLLLLTMVSETVCAQEVNADVVIEAVAENSIEENEVVELEGEEATTTTEQVETEVAVESTEEMIEADTTEATEEVVEETAESTGEVVEEEVAEEDVVESTVEAVVEEIEEITDEEAGETNQATEYTTGNGFVFYVVNGYAHINGYTGSQTEITIPATITYGSATYNVKEIANHAFRFNTSISKVTIPGSVSKIGFEAFRGCSSLREVNLGEGLVAIEGYAFYGCTSLKKIVVPSTVSNMDSGVFGYCSSLETANVKINYVPSHTFFGCESLKSVTLANNTVSIGSEAFYGCNSLESINIPTSIREINGQAFYKCESLKSVNLNEGLLTIGSYAFAYCATLESVIIPSTVTSLGEGAFRSCTALKAVNIKCATVSSSCFSYCTGLTSVTFSEKVTSIGGSSFTRCSSLRTITFPANLTVIGNSAFSFCDNLTTVEIPSSVRGLGDYAFSNCENLKTVYINASSIGKDAFYACVSLSTVTMGNNVKVIGDGAFKYCTKLKDLRFGSNITEIGSDAFLYTALGSGEVYCERNSVADNTELYPVGTKIRYGKPSVAAPKFTVKGVINGRNVTFNCDTEDVVIYYSSTSSNLTLSDKCVAAGTTITFNDFYGTVYARAYKNGVWSNAARLILKIPVVNKPAITQSNGKVTIKTTTPACAIYYTTDGSTPSVNNGTKINASAGSFYYTGGTIKAIAVRSCFTNSDIATAKVDSNVKSSIGVPSFGVKGVVGGRTVTFKSATSGSRIYYSTSSTISSNDKWVENGKSVTFENFYGTIYARTFKDGKWSNVSRLILKIPVVKTPTISYASGGYVNVKTATPGCMLYYTTDGTTPSVKNGRKINASSSKVYVGSGKTIKVIAVRSCFTNSEVASYNR